MAPASANFPLYHCPCTSSPASLPPASTHPSTAYSLHPLDSLYFCDDCDAIRCERCVQVEITSYYCPNCLFEVPNASVRAERNRCARNCFQCPECSSALHVVASDPPEQSLPPTSIQASMGQPPYFLQCRGCQWSSSQIRMSFEKPLGLAHQVLEQEKTSRETVEVDRLQSHFDHYIHRLTQSLERQAFLSAPRVKKSSGGRGFSGTKTRYPYTTRGNSPNSAGNLPVTRNIGNITASAAITRSLTLGSPFHIGHASQNGIQPGSILPAPISEDPNEYRAKYRWRDVACGTNEDATSGETGGQKGAHRLDDSLIFDDDDRQDIAPTSSESMKTCEAEQLEEIKCFEGVLVGDDMRDAGFANIEKLWDQPWAQPRSIRTQRPSRIPLLAKRTKRCPACTHTLIRPESKPHSTRFKIKIAAMSYLPGVEIGARRLVGQAPVGEEGSWHDGLRMVKVLQGTAERLNRDLEPGNIYAYQLALTNPLLESISVTLKPLHSSLFGALDQPERYFDVWFPQTTVPVGAFGETADDIATRKQDKAKSDGDAEWVKEGESVTKVGFCVVLHERLGRHLPLNGKNMRLHFDLNLEFTYTVEEEYTPDSLTSLTNAGVDEKAVAMGTDAPLDDRENKRAAKSQAPQLRKVEKTFSFDTRVELGEVSG